MNILTELFPPQPSQAGDARPIIKDALFTLGLEKNYVSEAVKNLVDDYKRLGHIGEGFAKRMNPLQEASVVAIDPVVAEVVQSMYAGNELGLETGLKSPFDVSGNDEYLRKVAATEPVGNSFVDKEQAQLRVEAAFADTDYSVTLPAEYRK
jgi:hypothetical protein